MKNNTLLFIATLVSFFLTSCMKYTSDKARKLDVLFPKGSLVPAENFTGSAWAKTLLPTDTTYNTIVGNVYIT